jgi:Flp pilus assembly protein TadD
MNTDKATERISNQLKAANVGLAIAEMEIFLTAWPQPQTAERLRAVKEEYELMTDYWQRGMEDPQRQEQYQRLLQRVYVLYANVAIHRHLRSSSFLTGLYNSVRQPGHDWSVTSVRQEMENFVSEVAMLDLEPEQLREEKSRHIYQEHLQHAKSLFNYVLTSRMWTDGVGRDFTEMLLSPTVDSVDQQMLVSAVMLSLLNQFDMVKFRLLTEVYRRSRDEHVRQRALVGWVFSIDTTWLSVYPEQRTIVAKLLESERVCKELTELQIQSLLTMNAKKDTATIQNEIMPNLMNNNGFRITRNGIEEVEEDPLEDVLHPDAAEQRMEQLEASYQRMMNMQRQGADVYFGGFSQMKRFPFFYDISNWLMPFYRQHPDIAQYMQKLADVRFLQEILQKGPFCNSDKYSFVIAFQQVMDGFPESLRRLMKQGDVPVIEMEDEEQHTPANIRRLYLMDLYRFFCLFPNRSAFRNPFDAFGYGVGDIGFFCLKVFEGTALEANKHEVVRAMKKYHYDDLAEMLLVTFPEEQHDVQYYLWMGNYDAALELDPDNERALAERARSSFEQGQYDEADDDYEHLLLLHPGKMGYMLNKAVCLVNMEEYEDAQKLLYQLNYEHADDVNVQRVLAWALTCDSKLEQAEKIYQQLVKLEHPSGEDYQNYAYCLWLQGRISEAADAFRKFADAETETNPSVVLDDAFDAAWLEKRGITDTDIKMMQTLAFGDDIQRLTTNDLPF